MTNKNTRQLKVVEQSGYNYKATPAINLKGKWLEALGFSIGDYVTVSCENGKIVITPKEECFVDIFEAHQAMLVAESKGEYC